MSFSDADHLDTNQRQTPNRAANSATLVCADGVPPEMLSAWRDDLLPLEQADRLARHAPTCAACRERLNDYDKAATAIHTQIIPHYSADLWAAVRDQIEREQRGASLTKPLRAQTGRLSRRLALGGAGAGVVALALIALFAGLLLTQRQPRITAYATQIASQTPIPTAHPYVTATLPPATAFAPSTRTATRGVWQNIANCADAPVSMRVIYNASITQQGGGTTILALQRGDDCGATWTDLTPPTIPGVDYGANVTNMSIFADPIDPQIAYLTVTVSGTTCVRAGGATAALSGSYCNKQFVTTDGGANWQSLQLPTAGALENPLVANTPAIIARGSTRYGFVSTYVAATSGVAPPGRLVSSPDGIHWSLIDAPLAAQKQAIYSYAIPATGSSIFVIAEPINDPSAEAPNYAPTLSTWISADNGATWRNAGAAPGSGQTGGASVVNLAAGVINGQAVLYMLDTNQGTLSLIATTDGRAWTTDNQFPAYGMTGGEIPRLLGVMPNGAVVASQPRGASPSDNPTLAWQLGGQQRVVAENPDMGAGGSVTFVQQPNGVYLWLATVSEGATTIRYTILQN